MSYKRSAAGAPPEGYSYLAPILSALEAELRAKVSESHEGKRKSESNWPVIQINHQRTRYVYDMYYVHHKISRALYDWCVRAKVVDAGLIGKWKKQGYEKLCSTYVINTTNYKFGGVSICRVPRKEMGEDAAPIQDPNTGCQGCASGSGSGNIFGNKYGQRLAAIQIAREARFKSREAAAEKEAEKAGKGGGDSETDDDSETDSSDDEGPRKPAAAGRSDEPAWGNKAEEDAAEELTKKIENGEEVVVDNGDDETDEDDDDDEEQEGNGGGRNGPAAKKRKS
jgi:bud site selection protein 31